MATSNLDQQEPVKNHTGLGCLQCTRFVSVQLNWNCETMKQKTRSCCRPTVLAAKAVDVILFVLLVAVLSLSFAGVIKPRGAGFYCDDSSIAHRYRGDTVKVSQLLLGSFIAPLLFFLPVEFVHTFNSCTKKTRWLHFVKQLLYAVWKRWRILLVGLLITLTLTEIGKAIVSEPRPHFWDTCKPNVTDTLCQQGYVSEYNCTSGFPASAIRDSMKSFPSGHASVSVFASCFMMWYFHTFVNWRRSFMLVPCLQFIWAVFALTSSLTRITDRRHHWWDVLAGSALGLAVYFVITRAQRKRELARQESGGDNAGEVATEFEKNKSSVARLISSSTASTSMPEDREMDFVNQEP